MSHGGRLGPKPESKMDSDTPSLTKPDSSMPMGKPQASSEGSSGKTPPSPRALNLFQADPKMPRFNNSSGLVVELVFCMKMVIITPAMGLWLAHRAAGVWLDTGGVKSSTIDRWLEYREGASILNSGLGSSQQPQVRWLDHRKGISESILDSGCCQGFRLHLDTSQSPEWMTWPYQASLRWTQTRLPGGRTTCPMVADLNPSQSSRWTQTPLPCSQATDLWPLAAALATLFRILDLGGWMSSIDNTTVPIANAMKLAINGNILKEKAILLALKMGQDNFEASNGWLEKFKARRNIAFKRLHGEAGSVDANSVATWKGFVMDEAMEEVVEEEMNRCFEALKKHQAIDVNYIDFLEVDKDVQVAGEQSIEEIVKEVTGKEEDEEQLLTESGLTESQAILQYRTA
ncbi:PDC2 [Cordylochernes scorpioides]|uniref:PDC2 n=1 Tax=Cordylochernes scorpioides TaxID=51811 RepID=A0ABY6K7J0_9ARAC|nr:PDC2 [Cordylochernes scorpioides]